MGQAGRRRRPARRRRGGSSALTAVAAAALGLVALGAPATELAAQLTAATTTARAAGTTVPAVPRVAPPPAGVVQAGVPEPVADIAVPALPVPGRVDLDVPTPLVPHGEPLEYTPPPAPCGGYGNPRQISPGVEPGAGSATVSWMADGHAEVRGYRVQAVSQRLVAGEQPVPPQQTVAQREDCGLVTVTMTGLTPGVPYVFWLEEQVLDEPAGVLRLVQVGRSAATVIG